LVYRVLVNGGAGFIGSHLVDGLMSQGFGVVVLDDFSGGKRKNETDVKRTRARGGLGGAEVA